MPALPWIIVGLGWPLLLTGPPPAGSWMDFGLATLLAAGLALAAPRVRRPNPGRFAESIISLLPGLALGLAASAGSIWSIERSLEQRLDRRYEPIPITGRIASLPEWHRDSLVFGFHAESGPWGTGMRRLEVRWYQPAAEFALLPSAGERWRLPLRLTPPRGRINFQGGDSERHFFAERIHGLGAVKETPGPDLAERLGGPRGHGLARIRAAVQDRLQRRLGDTPGAGLVLALGLGNRSHLSEPLRDAMRGTGTGHLLAISGLHVGLVGLFGFWLGRLFLGAIRWRGCDWPAQRLALLIALGFATVYAALAGFGTSPRRALLMLAVAAGALALRRQSHPWQGWLLALALVLVLDPRASLQAGFWLSFGAVAVLFHHFGGHHPPVSGGWALVRAQVGIMVVMLPMGMAWFQWTSASALGVNLLAIPWVSFIVLPLVLATLAGLVFEQGAAAMPGELAAHVAAAAASWLERFLLSAHELGPGLSGHTVAPGSATVVLAVLGGFVCLLPRGLRLRRYGALMFLPVLLPASHGLDPGEFRLELLDVGQGQAALVRTGNHRVLVDTGPGQPGQWDLVDSVLLPALRASGPGPPDLVLVSHADLDHAGGRARLALAWPGLALIGNASRRPSAMGACHDGLSWGRDGVTFRVLHPTRWLPYRGNDSSCVLEVRGAGGAMLLPGDIGHLVERRLSRQSAPADGYRLALAPHHGSRGSGTGTFLDWARPERVAIPVGWGNRFDFPHAETLARLADRDIAVAGTAECGALRFTLRADGRLEADSARRSRPAFWRFPAASHCPGNGAVSALTSPDAFRYHAGQSQNNSVNKE